MPTKVNPTVAAVFFLLLLLSSPHVSTGIAKGSDEVYDIDYRGPETHSSLIPPPSYFLRRPRSHQRSTKPSPKLKNLKATDTNRRT